MTNLELARWTAALLGVFLVLFGLAGFVDNPLVGLPAADPVFAAGTLQNVIHVGSGALILFAAFGMAGAGIVRALFVLAAGFGALFLLTVISPSLFGLFDPPANLACHVLHGGVAVLSATVAWLARGRPVGALTTV